MSSRHVDRRGFLRLTGTGVAGIAAAGFLAACGSGGDESGGASGAPGARGTSESAPGGSSGSGGSGDSWDGNLRVSMPVDVTSLDPQKQGDMPSVSVANNIFDFLVTRDAKNQLAPSIATEWS